MMLGPDVTLGAITHEVRESSDPYIYFIYYN